MLLAFTSTPHPLENRSIYLSCSPAKKFFRLLYFLCAFGIAENICTGYNNGELQPQAFDEVVYCVSLISRP